MKTPGRLLFLLLLLSAIGMTVMIFSLPDTVPVHYTLSGEPDRYGSRLEYFTFPALMALNTALILWIAKKQTEEKSRKVILRAGLCISLALAAVAFVSLYKVSHSENSSSGFSIRHACLFLGSSMILLSGVVPKVKRNSLLGLRTKWSMASESLWEKSQSFCGKSMLVAGVLLMLCALLSYEGALYGLMGILVLWTLANIYASYRFYKNE